MTNWEYYFGTPEKTSKMSIGFEPDEYMVEGAWNREGVLYVFCGSNSVAEIDIWDTAELEPALLAWLKSEKQSDNETEVIHTSPWTHNWE